MAKRASSRRESPPPKKKKPAVPKGAAAGSESDAGPPELTVHSSAGDEYCPIDLEQLDEGLRAAVKRAGWKSLMPVQSHAVPYLVAGRDLMVQSRTGSGKTGAFVLPIISRVDLSLPECQALVLAPTRELAQQVATEAERLAGQDGLRVVAVYGGVGYGPQLDAFEKGAHVVVGTPGRILDHLVQGNLRLRELEMLVFDEADRMLSMGFLPDMQKLKTFLPRHAYVTAMFSATYPNEVLSLARQFLYEPETLSLSRDAVHVTNTEHVFYMVPGTGKERALVRILEAENPHSAFIFCNRRQTVHFVATVLQRFGYDADEISSDLTQGAREKVLQRVRDGNLRFLVATDVAARGIDIPELSHVVQYEPPDDIEDYIHRAGRTSRAGASGVALTLVTKLEKLELNRIAKRYDIDFVERTPPQDEDVSAIVAQRVSAHLEARYRDRDKLHRERAQRLMPLVKALADGEPELLALLLDEVYEQSLHGKMELDEAPPAPPVPAERREESGPRRDGGGRGRGGGGKRGGGRPRR